MDARQRDEARGFGPAAARRTAYSAPGQVPGPAHPHEPDVHPLDARVRNLQEGGGWAPADIDASPPRLPAAGHALRRVQRGAAALGHGHRPRALHRLQRLHHRVLRREQHRHRRAGAGAKGRILHWIRIERYFDGAGDTLETQFLPMLCQHCGTAPCEPVCPVYAAYHTPEGLNAQVYNRCVGTRYCANNCPYKVRVFNWFSYEWPEPLNWQLNPDVTVRETGVMEKCTFCVQRIRDAQNTARLQDRGATDGEITPACAQTCPGDAIVFGNIKDPNSRVSRVAASGRGYRVFEGLNTQSAITYLKKVSLRAEPPQSAEGH
jgi:Fe-S-cluster-containing dehydrogenase component